MYVISYPMKLIFTFLFIFLSLFQGDLFSIEKVPYFTGSLFSSSSLTTSKKAILVEPYFSSNWNRSIHLFEQAFQPYIWVGLHDRFDLMFAPVFSYRRQNEYSNLNLEDFSAELGFQLIEPKSLEDMSCKVSMGQTFPTGKFQKFNSIKSKVQQRGSGAWGSYILISLGKLFLAENYLGTKVCSNLILQHCSKVSLEGINSYGGSVGFKGKVKPGLIGKINLSLESTITKNFSYAFDLNFQFNRPYKVIYKNGNGALIPQVHSYELLIAPALEYNPSSDKGFILGILAPVLKKNYDSSFGFMFAFTSKLR